MIKNLSEKRYTALFILLTLTISLAGCSWSKDDNNLASINDAEKEDSISPSYEMNAGVTLTNSDDMEENAESEIEGVESELFTKEASILLTNTKKLDDQTYRIFGETSDNCSKIIVNAYDVFKKNFDVYTLDTYQYGDTTFEYGIREDWNNLRDGENTYIFTAYCDNDQIKEAITAINYYGTYTTDDKTDDLVDLQEEIKKLEAQVKEYQKLQQTPENTNQQSNANSGHVFYTSNSPAAKLYYCDTDPEWKKIPIDTIRYYLSEAELLADFPNKTLNKVCQ